MEHLSAGTPEGRAGSPDWFTGSVVMQPLVTAAAPSAMRAVMVTFAAGARTHWHTHPLGQMIHVISGRGRAQAAGGAVVRIGPGDTVWFPAGELHWHGADPDAAMVHLAVQEADANGVSVTWGAAVTEADYSA